MAHRPLPPLAPVGWTSISDEYRYGLRDLTFNSRPIINNLTLFAQDHVGSAPALARVLTDHLVNCPEDYKLPALYLIDSVLKNIGEPYIRLLTNLLPNAFAEAFRQLENEQIRRDFMRTVDTWWNVFPIPLIREIQTRAFSSNLMAMGPRRHEDGTFDIGRSVRPYLEPAINVAQPMGPPGATKIHPTLYGFPSVPPPPPTQFPITHSHPHPLPNFNFVQYAPSYPLPDLLIRILLDLRSAMTVPPELYNEKFVADVMYRLEYECQALGDLLLFRAVDERARIPDKRHLIDLIDSLVVFSQGASAMTVRPPLNYDQAISGRIPPPIPQQQQSLNQPPLPLPLPPQQQQQQRHPRPPLRHPISSSTPIMAEHRYHQHPPTSQQHFIKSPVLVPQGRESHHHGGSIAPSSLMKSSGSFDGSKSPIPPSASPAPQSTVESPSLVNLPDISPLLASLSSLPLNLPMNFTTPTTTFAPITMSSANISSTTTTTALTTTPSIRLAYEEIIKNRPDAYQNLYGALPRQCTNCGLRFPDTVEGQRRLDEHLDAHFRRNIRLKDKAKKVLARLWWLAESDWIKSKERGGGGQDLNEIPAILFKSSGIDESKIDGADTEDEIKNISMVKAESDHADRTCPLCHERVQIIWDDESDEWMYSDATKADNGEIVHAHCHTVNGR